jgi:cytochrome d ubiquinol oxidase subunit I
VLVPLQIVIGDEHGLNTLEHQPAKLAAIEARWDTARQVPLTLFAIPDQQNETNRFAIDVPYLGCLILTHSFSGEIKGLKEWAPEDRPPVIIPFFAFRIMVGIGLLMLALLAVSWWLRIRDTLFDSPWFLAACLGMAPLGFVAVLAGWTTTEVGRQPWTIYGLMRTADSVPLSLTGADALVSLLGYMAVYLVIFPAGVFIMAKLARKGPAAGPDADSPIESGRPAGPALIQLHSEGDLS